MFNSKLIIKILVMCPGGRNATEGVHRGHGGGNRGRRRHYCRHRTQVLWAGIKQRYCETTRCDMITNL